MPNIINEYEWHPATQTEVEGARITCGDRWSFTAENDEFEFEMDVEEDWGYCYCEDKCYCTPSISYFWKKRRKQVKT